MNLLTSSELKLDRQQEKVIYELTLKKQRSKKSTMSEKQVAAMQQLAGELVSERKDFSELLNYQQSMQSQNALSHHQNHHNQHQLCRCSESTLALAAVAVAVAEAEAVAATSACDSREHPTHLHTGTNSTGSKSTGSTSSSSSSSSSSSCAASTSSSRSEASLSPSSSSASDIPREQILHITSNQLDTPGIRQGSKSNFNSALEHKRQPLSPTAEAAIIARHKNPISGSSFISTTSTNFSSSSARTTSSSSLMSDETNIKLSQLRLEQLNNELERRLHQYEYLVAQEKAILGAYKMNLFTSEGVNNFHLFSLDQRSQYYK